ncbi:MAG: RluA family pseudouridine synthase [Deltaproteobacteria bacterium]|nr:RluA family pseudouridine synthase [Deltaproteobacteria bacterium]
MKKVTFKKNVSPGDPDTVCDFLALNTRLSKTRIKDAMTKGAVWVQKKRGKRRRIRRTTTPVKTGDFLALYYDERLLAVSPPTGKCVADKEHYSIWYKPPGLMTQGTMYGDHCSLLRQAETFFKSRRKVFPVQRLDREASGLVLVAHSREAASKLSRLFQNHQIEKHYRIEVHGNLFREEKSGTITQPLDGKDAITDYEVYRYDPVKNTSEVNVVIKTGRLHQIRRHFEMIGFPVMGDPRYGSGNKNSEGMQIMAVALQFICPFAQQQVVFKLDEASHTLVT